MPAKVQKKVRMKLVGEDGNAFAIMGRFSRAAREQGWTKPEIDAVLTKAQSGDYNNLLRVMIENVDEPEAEFECDCSGEDHETDDCDCGAHGEED